jgi:hypothetical protein
VTTVTYRNRPAILALAFLGTVLITGCTPNPEASHPSPQPTAAPTTPEASTTATPTTTPPAGPPERPAAAEGLTLAAAEAFVHYYSDLMNYASDTGDGTALLSASDSGCENCKVYADFVKKSNAANGLLTGDYHEHITEVSELVRGQSGRLGGSAILKVGKYVSRETPTATPITSKSTNYTREIALSPQSGNWVMFEMKLVEQ